MARLTIVVLVIIVILVCGAPSLDARKTLHERKSIMEGSVVKGAILKGASAPPSALSEKLLALHLARVERMLEESVPSPAAGH